MAESLRPHQEEIAIDRAWRSRLRTTADLARTRREVRALLERAGVPERAVVDLLLAMSELLTNALQAADPGSPVTSVITVEAGDVGDVRIRRIAIEVTNLGDPIPGRLVVSPLSVAPPSSASGRGLPVAARMGDVVVEGMVGGTRATFRRTLRIGDDGTADRSSSQDLAERVDHESGEPTDERAVDADEL